MTELEVFGRPFYEPDGVALLLSSLGLNVIVIALIVGAIYFRRTGDRDHAFMMVTLNLVVFLVAFFMNSVEVGVGFGFGLFALFGIVRYRTESVPVREMSFLFVVIAMGLTNAVGATTLTWVEVGIANLTMLVTLAGLSTLFWRHQCLERDVVYDDVSKLRPERRNELLHELRERTGLVAVGVEVVSVNLINDSAVLRVRCESEPSSPNSSPSSTSTPIRTEAAGVDLTAGVLRGPPGAAAAQQHR